MPAPEKRRFASVNHLFPWPSLRHIDVLNLAFVPFLRDIEPAITASELFYIRHPVYAGADYIHVCLITA